MTDWTYKIGDDLDTVLRYLSTKTWEISLDRQHYEQILNREATALLRVIKNEFDEFRDEENRLDLLFPIIWNELDHDWLPSSPYLVSKRAWQAMRRYMTMQREWSIPGPTSVFFSALRRPNLMLRICSRNTFSFRTELWGGGVPALTFFVSGNQHCERFIEQRWKEIKMSDEPEDFPAIDHLELSESVRKPDSEETNEFETLVRRDLANTGYSESLRHALRHAGCRDPEGKDRIPKLHKSLALLSCLLKSFGGEPRELLYSFSSSAVDFGGRSFERDSGYEGGGFVFLSPSMEHVWWNWWKYRLLTVVAVAKLGSVEKLFRRHSERKFALRSATASIMARNWAHHYGSHIRPLTGLLQIEKRLNELRPGTETKDTLARLRERLDNYVSEKAAYIAEVTSEPLTTTKRAMFYREIILPLIQNTLFMDCIARNEGLGYEDLFHNTLKLRVFRKKEDKEPVEMCAEFSCKPGIEPVVIRYPCESFPYDTKCKAGVGVNEYHTNHSGSKSVPETLEFVRVDRIGPGGSGSTDYDVAIELPGPIGEHALYGILENLIRNSAKYNRSKGEKDRQFLMCISEPEDESEARDYYWLELWDNVTNPDEPVSLTSDRDAEQLTLFDKIKKLLRSEIVGPSLEVNPEAWGLAEMKINAALLAGSSSWDKLGHYFEVLKGWEREGVEGLISYGSRPDAPSHARLVYRLRLMKSRRLCMVLSQGRGTADLERQGIFVFSEFEQLTEYFERQGFSTDAGPRSPATFDFAIIERPPDDSDREWTSKVSNVARYLPARLILIDDSDPLPSGLPAHALVRSHRSLSLKEWQSHTPNAFLQEVWLTWIKRWGRKSSRLHLSFDQESTDVPPTSTWLQIANRFVGPEFPLRLTVWDSDERPHGGEYRRKDEDERELIFDRHGTLFSRLVKFPQPPFYEKFEKGNPDFALLFSPKVDLEGGKVNFISPSPYRLGEAALSQILILDERVAQRTSEWVDGTRRGHVARMAGVWIATHLEINRSVNALHPQIERDMTIEDFPRLDVQVHWEGNSFRVKTSPKPHHEIDETRGYDIVIIHQGILETYLPKGRNEFLSLITNEIPLVIVTSGRGIPPDVQQNKKIRFIPFSLLEHLVLGQGIAKIRLTSLCMKLTRGA